MYTKEELNEYSLFYLREIASALGVKRPSTKKKRELINDIIDVETGLVEPCYSLMGRPRLKTASSDEKQVPTKVIPEKPKKIDPIEEEIDRVLSPIKELLMRLLSSQHKHKK